MTIDDKFVQVKNARWAIDVTGYVILLDRTLSAIVILVTLRGLHTMLAFGDDISYTSPLEPVIKLVFSDDIVIVIKEDEFKNSDTLVRLSPMVTVARFVQVENALIPIDVTPLPMVTDDRFLQNKNAFVPIDVTESGMVIDVKCIHSVNAFVPIDIIPTPKSTE
jgi:hypothetical protein